MILLPGSSLGPSFRTRITTWSHCLFAMRALIAYRDNHMAGAHLGGYLLRLSRLRRARQT